MSITTTYTIVEMEVSAGAFDEIKSLLLKANYDHAVYKNDDNEVLDMRGIGLISKSEAVMLNNGHERIEYVEPSSTVKVLAGVFLWTDQEGTRHVADFYVNTCEDIDDEDYRSKRQSDLNEQFSDEYDKLLRTQREVHYIRTDPDPFF